MFEGDPQENIKRDLRRLVDDVAQLRVALMSGKREQVEHFKDAAKEQFDWARGEAKAKVQEVDQYVKDKPWVAVGVAAAVGAVLGMLLLKGKHRE
jgi:ElaB/YqjD/DUF883 family membrane-anchored ribosome-binding protein